MHLFSKTAGFQLWGVLSLLTLLSTGCGDGGGKVGGPAPGGKNAPTSTASSSSSNMQAPQLKPRKVKPQPKQKTQPAELQGNPDDHFEVVDYVHNYQIQKPDPERVTGEEFAVMKPAGPGLNASTFTVIKPEATEEPAQPDAGFKLPKGFTALKEYGYSAEGLPRRIRCDRDYSEMVLVSAGVSVQGAKTGDKNAQPQFSILQDTFYIDVHEVTLEQYRRWRSEMIAAKGKIPEPAGNDQANASYPAMGIAYTDAINYARTMGKQLPLETQWEKAARGERGFDYPWGDGRPLWHKNRRPGQIDAVKSFPGDLSPYGAYDMAGNAREWCDDWYSPTAYQSALARSDAGVVRGWTGPKLPVVPGERVARGSRDSWKAWKRGGENMRTPSADVGFRCVLNLSAGEKQKDKTTRPANAF
ncbi:formylglycine-generating enzyme family protein [Gimesia panareensis]|uniref:formylglycine-generating enzyme family protein n=1 Tax=Gimesia panareensis TaxID=2527978 RepID=UPI00118B38E3|nr:SUMF1/EgtB/PvdO family nonheme iron enzyme [Gimesia panareensis]QDU51158.1 Serine/threonine-protein kinase pkn1 [Gimesia panareensis]